MLHSAMLPHHTKWFQLFEQLRVIVIDELHTYRGVFGIHVANVLRRLLRICAHYGVEAGDRLLLGDDREPWRAREHADRAARPRSIDRNGAPSGEKHVLLVDPPVIDPATGARGSALTLAQRGRCRSSAPDARRSCSAESRVAVEIMLSNLRETLREDSARGAGSAATGAATCRRSAGRSSAACATARSSASSSTNALELGVDIGRLDVAILAGYPGSIAGHVAAIRLNQ